MKLCDFSFAAAFQRETREDRGTEMEDKDRKSIVKDGKRKREWNRKKQGMSEKTEDTILEKRKAQRRTSK